MSLVVIAFIVPLSIVLGTYWTAVLRPEAAAVRRVRQRLHAGVAAVAVSPSVVRTTPRLAATAGVAGYVARRVSRLVTDAGVTRTPRQLALLTAAAACVAMIAARAAGTQPLPAITAALAGPAAMAAYLTSARRRRLAAFAQLFPDAIDLMGRALRAGQALTSAMAIVGEEVPAPVGPEFRLLAEQHNYGLPLSQAMKNFAERVPLIEVRFFVTAVVTQRELGGNLAEVLDNLAAVARDRFRVRRQLQVLTAQGQMTGWVLGLFPLVLAVVLYWFNPEQANAFLVDPLGRQLLLTAIALQTLGTFMIRRIVRAEY